MYIMIVYIFVVFIILCILEYFIIQYLKNNKTSLIHDNSKDLNIQKHIDNQEKINQFFKDTMNERVQMLNEMDYQEWIDYNQKNCLIQFIDHENKINTDDMKFYLFIYEKTNVKDNDDDFILRCSLQDEFLNLNYSIERDIVMHKHIILELVPPLSNLPSLMYDMSLNSDGFNSISYNWESVRSKQPIKKDTIFTKWSKDDFNGVIGMGSSTKELNSIYGNIYVNFIDTFLTIIIHIVILLTPIVIFLFNEDNVESLLRSIFIIIITWVFLIHQYSLTTTMTNLDLETKKMTEISQNNLSLTFLLAANIFIIQFLNQEKGLKQQSSILKNELMYLFCIVVIFLVISLCKLNSYKNIEEVTCIRVRSQIFSNFSCFFSCIMCGFFIMYIFNNFKFISSKLKFFNTFSFLSYFSKSTKKKR